MAGPRKATILTKLQSIIQLLKASKYKESVKLEKVTAKVESLASSISDGVKAKKSSSKTSNPYILFMKAESKKIKAAHPDMKQTDIMGKVAKLWREKNGQKAETKPKTSKPKTAKKTK